MIWFLYFLVCTSGRVDATFMVSRVGIQMFHIDIYVHSHREKLFMWQVVKWAILLPNWAFFFIFLLFSVPRSNFGILLLFFFFCEWPTGDFYQAWCLDLSICLVDTVRYQRYEMNNLFISRYIFSLRNRKPHVRSTAKEDAAFLIMRSNRTFSTTTNRSPWKLALTVNYIFFFLNFQSVRLSL